jgi:cadmium resistance protein CadD (predicted permease)
MMSSLSALTLESAAHVIQVALTPVFLLSGIAALLNVFAGRLARVADRLETLTGGSDAPSDATNANAEIARLHTRTRVLVVAVVLSTAAAAATCLAIMTLFLLGLSNATIASVLLFFFGVAVLCTLGSVGAYGLEMLLSSREIRRRMHFHVPLAGFWHRGRQP